MQDIAIVISTVGALIATLAGYTWAFYYPIGLVIFVLYIVTYAIDGIWKYLVPPFVGALGYWEYGQMLQWGDGLPAKWHEVEWLGTMGTLLSLTAVSFFILLSAASVFYYQRGKRRVEMIAWAAILPGVSFLIAVMVNSLIRNVVLMF